MGSRVFRPSPLPAHKPAWAWVHLTFGLFCRMLVEVSSRNRGSGNVMN